MRVVVDLDKCQDHGQCVYAAPTIFSVDEDGKLAFRHVATGVYRSDELDDSLLDGVEEAADTCPMQAISIED